MVDARNKFAQPDEDTPFGRHLKEVTRYLNVGIPSFTGTHITTLPAEECWMTQVHVPGRTFTPVTEPIEFSFDAPTWSLGKSMAACWKYALEAIIKVLLYFIVHDNCLLFML